jgi:hypothetical protein
MRTHDLLRGGSRARLATLRKYVADRKHDQFVASCISKQGSLRGLAIDWRKARTFGIARIFPECMDNGTGGLREYEAHEVLRLWHTGWYTDPDVQDGLLIGKVWQLPAKNGECRFIAGYLETSSGYVAIERDRDGAICVHDDKKDAACAANEFARIAAERESEFQTRWREAAIIQDKCTDLAARICDCRQSLRNAIAVLRSIGPRERKARGIMQRAAREARKQASDLIVQLRERRDELDDTGMECHL